MEPFLLYYDSGCYIHRQSQNTARHALSLKERRHASAWNKISAAFYTFDKLRLCIQLDVYSPSTANLPVSKCYASANFAAEPQQLYLRTKVYTLRLSFLAVFHLSSSRKLAVSCTKILLTFRVRPAPLSR